MTKTITPMLFGTRRSLSVPDSASLAGTTGERDIKMAAGCAVYRGTTTERDPKGVPGRA